MEKLTTQNGRKWLIGELQTVHPSEIPQKLTDIQERLHKSILRKCRRAITGDPDK